MTGFEGSGAKGNVEGNPAEWQHAEQAAGEVRRSNEEHRRHDERLGR